MVRPGGGQSAGQHGFNEDHGVFFSLFGRIALAMRLPRYPARGPGQCSQRGMFLIASFDFK